MKVFGKLLAIAAFLLSLGAILIMGSGYALDIINVLCRGTPNVWYFLYRIGNFLMAIASEPVLPVLLFSGLMIFLMGRKKGVAIPEILILLVMLFAVPVAAAIFQYLSFWFNELGWYAPELWGEFLPKRLAEAFSLGGIQEYFAHYFITFLTEPWKSAFNSVQYYLGLALYTSGHTVGWVLTYVAVFLTSTLPASFAYLANILLLASCGVSMGLLAANKKKAAEAEKDLEEAEEEAEEEPEEAEEFEDILEEIKETVAAELKGTRKTVRVVPVKKAAEVKGE